MNDALMAAWMAGTISESERKELLQRTETHPDTLEQLADQAELDRLLRAMYVPRKEDGKFCAELVGKIRAGVSEEQFRKRIMGRLPRRRKVAWLFVAAAAALLIAGLLWLSLPTGEETIRMTLKIKNPGALAASPETPDWVKAVARTLEPLPPTAEGGAPGTPKGEPRSAPSLKGSAGAGFQTPVEVQFAKDRMTVRCRKKDGTLQLVYEGPARDVTLPVKGLIFRDIRKGDER